MTFLYIYAGKIGNIVVDIEPVIEINQEAMLLIHLFDTHNSSYSGSFNITIISSSNKTKVLYYESAPHRISYPLRYQYTDNYTVQVIAENEVSKMNKNVSFKVVCK